MRTAGLALLLAVGCSGTAPSPCDAGSCGDGDSGARDAGGSPGGDAGPGGLPTSCVGLVDGASCLAADGALGTCTSETCFSSLCGTHSDGNLCHLPGGSLSFCWDGYCLPLGCPAGGTGMSCAAGGRAMGVLGTCCDGNCAALEQDPANCGGCGNVCNGYCYEGACWSSGCPGGAPSLLDAGGCVDPSNLGFRFCEAADGGFIGYVSYLGFGQVCVDLLSDPANCGAPLASCPSPQTCVNGSCSGDVAPCGTGAQQGLYCALAGGGQGVCCPGGGCDDVATDTANCGVCGGQCETGFGCLDGACLVLSCASPNAESGVTPCLMDGGSGLCCGTACVDTASDLANCGGCGEACGTGETCSAGSCGFDACDGHTGAPCHFGSGALRTQGECCGGACIDMTSDPGNCGGCGVTCPSGAACVASHCT